MFGRITLSTAAAAVMLTAAPAFAAENPVGGQMGGMWTQEAPTGYLNTEMGAVLAPRVQYISASGGGLNYRVGLGSGTEVMAMAQLGLTAGGASSFGANLGAGYKQQLTRAGNMAMAFRLAGMLNNLGGAVPGTAAATAAAMAAAMGAGAAAAPGVGIGVQVGLPITYVVEDNGFACDTPTAAVWGEDRCADDPGKLVVDAAEVRAKQEEIQKAYGLPELRKL
jgi:hypothetical protein